MEEKKARRTLTILYNSGVLEKYKIKATERQFNEIMEAVDIAFKTGVDAVIRFNGNLINVKQASRVNLK